MNLKTSRRGFLAAGGDPVLTLEVVATRADELDDPDTGGPLAVIDLAWPNGLQEGLSEPVALLLSEGGGAEEAINRTKYLDFTDVQRFGEYVRWEILALQPVGV